MIRKSIQSLNLLGKSSFSSITLQLVITLIQPKFEVYRLDEKDFATEIKTTPEELMSIFKKMAEMRRMEIVIDQAYKNQEIRGFCHLYDGQV